MVESVSSVAVVIGPTAAGKNRCSDGVTGSAWRSRQNTAYQRRFGAGLPCMDIGSQTQRL
ncbi:MAG: hypothetical protein CM15mP120_06040 [Pseudomonadota bacterium]|nr:MAG: hypothetical protein CM15mP120_06040 [Pseudomonadota bacterium]